MTVRTMRNEAILSDDGVYRYSLTRVVGGADASRDNLLFVMINPSTADAKKNDHTIRKCLGYAQRWGFRFLRVVNPYAYRATKIADLAVAHAAGIDICGPDNTKHITAAIAWADEVVVAWGDRKKLKGIGMAEVDGRLKSIERLLPVSTKCIGFTKGGDPMHPLTTSYDLPLKLYFSDNFGG